ncbi:hypothetical protein [Raineyella fluvialis]|uniref:hypothetical protein n=1 Tax=Raineyella fluvialis TaxID=2662261 RepID=UPI001E2E5EED|nr:hypothetical protein [Raineyella fluvialis]
MTQPPTAWSPPPADPPVAPPVAQPVQNPLIQGTTPRPGYTPPARPEPHGWASTLPQAGASQGVPSQAIPGQAIPSQAAPPPVAPAGVPVAGVTAPPATGISAPQVSPHHAAPPSQPARPGQTAQPNPTSVEAPAPTPPGRVDHGLPVTTTDSMPGRTITAVIGDVMGVVSRSRELGGNREIQSRTMLTERQQAVTRMVRMALGPTPTPWWGCASTPAGSVTRWSR